MPPPDTKDRPASPCRYPRRRLPQFPDTPDLCNRFQLCYHDKPGRPVHKPMSHSSHPDRHRSPSVHRILRYLPPALPGQSAESPGAPEGVTVSAAAGASPVQRNNTAARVHAAAQVPVVNPVRSFFFSSVCFFSVSICLPVCHFLPEDSSVHYRRFTLDFQLITIYLYLKFQ